MNALAKTLYLTIFSSSQDMDNTIRKIVQVPDNRIMATGNTGGGEIITINKTWYRYGVTRSMSNRDNLAAPLLALLSTPLIVLGVIGAVIGLAVENQQTFFWAIISLLAGAVFFRIALGLRTSAATKTSA